MSETLLIHYNPATAQQASWSLCNNEGELTMPVQTGELAELTELSRRRPSVILLHSQCLHINHLNLPAMSTQKLMRAVPYAVEEFIAADVEDFHFVATTDKASKLTAVVGIDRHTLQKIIDIFRSHGVFIDKIIPDVLCINGNNTQWACLRYADDCYLQTAQFEGMVLTPDLLDYVIDSKLSSAEAAGAKPEKLLVFTEQEDDSEQPAPGDGSVEVVDIRYNQHPLVIFSGNYKLAEPLNLLQHSFRQKRESTGYWRHWRLAASLAAVWLVLSLSITGYQSSIVAQQNSLIEKEIASVFRSTFPGSRIIPGREKKLMQDNLDALRSGSSGGENSLLYLLTESFGTLKSDPQNITLQTLTYRNNKVEIGLEGSNLQAIENLNSKLNQSDRIQAEITSSSSEKDRVRGNIRIEGRTEEGNS